MRQTNRGWHLQMKCDCELADLSAQFNAVLRGWKEYYARYNASAMSAVWLHMNDYLVRWLMRKYKSLARHKTRAWQAGKARAGQQACLCALVAWLCSEGRMMGAG